MAAGDAPVLEALIDINAASLAPDRTGPTLAHARPGGGAGRGRCPGIVSPAARPALRGCWADRRCRGCAGRGGTDRGNPAHRRSGRARPDRRMTTSRPRCQRPHISGWLPYVYHPPLQKPGYYYSNTNYILAQLILEKATGHSPRTGLIIALAASSEPTTDHLSVLMRSVYQFLKKAGALQHPPAASRNATRRFGHCSGFPLVAWAHRLKGGPHRD
jgi:hypothetical protein